MIQKRPQIDACGFFGIEMWMTMQLRFVKKCSLGFFEPRDLTTQKRIKFMFKISLAIRASIVFVSYI